MKKSFRRIAILILQIIFAICMFALAACSGSCSSCSSCSSCNRDINPDMPENVTTTRKPVPTDGSTPTEHNGADTIAYLAYVLDNQPYYHAYANNSTRAMAGYEQITQTWKEYKNAELSGKNAGIMICSDISYSTFVKSATQSCFVNSNNDAGDAVYMRNGSKPSKDSTALNTEWSTDAPTYYSRNDYLTTYGEFSTELTVYVINNDTIDSVGEVTDNGDGTYSINAKLTPDAACWYQYGMKTRGGLKSFPVYHKIDITFTFDAQWQVLQTYCEESATINPSALGGMDSSSNSKTTTTFDYSEEGFDNGHYSYYPDYFDKYVGQVIVDEPAKDDEPDLISVLAGGFGQVISEEGQQFALSLTVGDTEYDGNIYVNVANLEISNLDIRLALGKKDSGKQDLYVEYGDGEVNAYYSDGFAATADINKVAGSVTRLINWINGISGSQESVPQVQAEEEASGIDLASLITLVSDGFGFNDTSVWIEIKSDDLLGLGIGIDARLDFSREITEEGNNYAFTKLQLSEISYNGEKINVSGSLLPDDGTIITHNPAETPADVADYIDGVVTLIDGRKYGVSVNFDGAATDMAYVRNVKLRADALINLSEDYKTLYLSVPVTASYSGLAVELTAYYTIDFVGGGYGTVYLNLTKIGEQDTDVKVYCDIAEVKTSVEQLINGVQTLSEEEEASATVATLINKVLSLDFKAIIKEVKGNSEKIELGIGVDELLNALEVDLGIDIGTVTLSLGLNGGNVSLEGSIPSFGASLEVVSSEGTVSMPDPAGYLNVADYVDGAKKLLSSPAYEIGLSVVNADLKLVLDATAYVQPENNFNSITVYAPVSVKLGDNKISLTAYYSIDLSNGDYGKVYLSIESINGSAADAKIYCDIKNTVNTVNQIIALFDKNSGVSVQSEESEQIADIISKVISINYATLIEELKADASGLNLSVNADYLLGELGVSLGEDLTLGTLSLSLTVDKDNNLTLSGALEELGADLTVKAYNKTVTLPDLDKYADAEEYLKGAYRLIDGRSYSVSLGFDGSAIDNEYIKNATLNGKAYLNLSEDFSELSVKLALTAGYSDLTAKLTAYYTIDFNSGDYGTVYLYISEIGGKQADVKIYADISEAKNYIEQLIGSAEMQSADGAGSIANIIDTVLSLDFGAIIKEIKANGENIQLSIGVDEILKAFDVNLEVGTVQLYLAFVDGELTLGGSVPALGLTLGVAGEQYTVTMPDPDGYANANDYIESIYNLLANSEYEVRLSLTETELGLSINSTAYIALENGVENISVYAPVTVTYGEFTVNLSAYYTVSLADKNYGKVFLTVDTVNEERIGLKVYCDLSETVDAVGAIIASFKTDSNGVMTQSEETDTVAQIISKIISLDYASLMEQLKADGNGLAVTVNADELLGSLGVALGEDLKLGTLSLSLTLDKDDKAVLSAGLDGLSAYGLNVNGSLLVKASKADITVPDEKDYLDLNELIAVVSEAIRETQAIIKAKDIEFTVNTTLTIDGVKMHVEGYGEVNWNDDIKVALHLEFSIAENGAPDTVTVNFVYDPTVKEKDDFVRFTVNDLGFGISEKDIDGVEKLFGQVMDTVNAVINGNVNSGDINADAAAVYGAAESVESEETAVNYVKILNAVLKAVSKVTVDMKDVNGEEIENALKNIVIGYADNVGVTLGANGGLSLDLGINNNNGTDIISLSAFVKSGNGGKIEEINSEIGTVSKKETFLKTAYYYVLGLIDNLSVKNVLGTDTYSVEFMLDGTLSGIDALDGIYVYANLYYTENDSKLIEADVTLNINGTEVLFNACYQKDYIYISLTNVGGTNLSGVDFKANTDAIYDAAKTLVEIITGDTLAAILSNLTGEASKPITFDSRNAAAGEGETSKALTDVLSYILSLDFNEVISYEKIDGVNTLTVNPDGILNELGVDISVGTCKVEINPVSHIIKATVNKGEGPWLTFNAQTLEAGEYKLIDETQANKFIDMSFVSTLLEDLKTTLDSTKDKNGNVDLRFTFTGDIRIGVSVFGVDDIVIENIKLTVGLDEDKEFYFSLYGELKAAKAEWIFDLAKAGDICITYSKGYITLGRHLGTGDESYKVVTLAYLLDNMLDSKNSPIFWLLDTGYASTIVGWFTGSVNISSGLETPQDYYLYEEKAESDGFNLSSLLKGLFVSLADNEGNEPYVYGDPFNTLVNDNVYAFALDLESLLGDTLTDVRAAIVRNGNNENGGIKGLKAHAGVAGMLDVNVNLDDGMTNEHAPNYFKQTGLSDIEFKDKSDNEIFGCYTTNGATVENGKTDYTNVLDMYTLKIINLNGTETLVKLRDGSTVHGSETLGWLSDTTRLVYNYENGNYIEEGFKLDKDITIKAGTREYERVDFTLVSQVEFRLDGVKYSGKYELHGFGAGEGSPIADAVAVSSEYLFIGWAKQTDENNSELEFTQAVAEEGAVYYAIWGVKRPEITSIKAPESGRNPDAATATINSRLSEAKGCVWYAYENWTEKVDAITTETTILYARLQYSLIVNIEVSKAGSTKWGYTSNDGADVKDMSYNVAHSISGNDGEFNFDGTQYAFEGLDYVLEGYTVQILRYYTNGIMIRVYDGETCVVTHLIKGFSTSFMSASLRGQFDNGTSSGLAIGEGWNANYTGNGDIQYNSDNNLYYTKTDNGGTPLLFATMKNVSGKVSFTAKVAT